MGGLGGRRRSPVHRIALSPACWGINEAPDWGHQIDVERVLSEAAAIGEGPITAGPPGFLPVGSEAGVCLDIAHLVIAGADPIEVIELAAGRIQHVHLNDVDLDLARRVRDRSLSYNDAVARSLYRPVGEGGAKVAKVTEALKHARYRGWYTLEQETRLVSHDDRPLGRISRSLEFVLPLLG